VGPGALVKLTNAAKPSGVFWTIGTHASVGPASVVAGTILAQSHVTLSSCTLLGAALSLHASVTLADSSVTLPQATMAAATSGPAYVVSVNLGGAASFAVLAASQITNTVRVAGSDGAALCGLQSTSSLPPPGSIPPRRQHWLLADSHDAAAACRRHVRDELLCCTSELQTHRRIFCAE